MNTQQAFARAVNLHEAGRLTESEALYRLILTADPGHADASLMLGVVAAQTNRLDFAVELISGAIARKPVYPEAHCNLGNVLKEKGDLDAAIASYRQAIAFRPDFSEAHYNLGVALSARGNVDEAMVAYRNAVLSRPNYPEALTNLGNALKEKGRIDEAITVYRKAIVLKPNYAKAYNNLGNALKEERKLEAAITTYRQAISLKPDYFEAHSNLGNALYDDGDLDQAAAAYRQAIALKPDYAQAHNHLGNALRAMGNLDDAIAAYRTAIFLNPNFPEGHSNLSNALRDKGNADEAIAACRQALALKLEFPDAHNNLGNALRDRGQLEDAIAAYRQAITLKPNFPQAHSNLGTALRDVAQLDEAIAACRKAISLDPDYPEAHFALALALLTKGEFRAGWEEYEWRFQLKEEGPAQRNFTRPQWDGCPLAGRTVLLHAEQGLGDTLQFIRYAPLVARAGGRVVVECQPGLQRLLQNVEGISQILVSGEALPSFDLHCPLMSLPLAFGTKIETIPREIPYLQADPEKAALWRKRLKSEVEKLAAGQPSSETMLKVGLVWAGGSRPHQRGANRIDQRRSISLAQFAALAEVSGVLLVSLQKGPPAEQALAGPRGLRLLDWTTDLEDFADTAALIEALDLVISVDTAVVHLAGALGKPVWMLNRFDTCWRWLLNRTDSPWYPTLRLFRQPRLGDWGPVISQVCKELEQVGKSRP